GLDAELCEGPDTGADQREGEDHRQEALAERQPQQLRNHRRPVAPAARSARGGLPSSPFSSITPSMAIVSPSFTPAVTRTRSPARRPTVTCRCSNVPGAVSTKTTLCPSLFATTAAKGTTVVRETDSM